MKQTLEIIPAAPLLEAVDRWLAEGDGRNLVERDLGPSCARAIRLMRSGVQSGMGLDAADRLLCKIDRPELLRELAPPTRKPHSGYTWPKPHPLRKLSQAQVEAAHVLHWQGGLSLRELGRRLWEQLGYSSPHSCAAALSAAFMRDGLPRRDRIEAALAANDRMGYVRGRTSADRKRERRARLRAADPAFREEERGRLEELHRREARA